MEFLLRQKEDSLWLPVPPSEFNIPREINSSAFNVEGYGEVNFIGKRKLQTIGISSFFPKEAYYFCQYTKFPEPYDCVNLISKWQDNGEPIRLIISETPINMECSIERFEYGENDGTSDVNFQLDLKEYRRIEAACETVGKWGYSYDKVSVGDANSIINTVRPVTKTIPKNYTVKSKDTLFHIAKKFTGSGMNYKNIAEKNNIKNPDKIYVGQVLNL